MIFWRTIMCDLCESDPKLKAEAVTRHLVMAEKLDGLAMHYRRLARGVIMPHTEEAQHVDRCAKAVIRDLVNDWF